MDEQKRALGDELATVVNVAVASVSKGDPLPSGYV